MAFLFLNHPACPCFLSALYEINADLVGKTWESPEGVPIGTVACSLLCLVMAFIVLLDMNKLWQDLKMMRGNIESMMKHRHRNRVSDSTTCINAAAANSSP